MPNPKMRCFMAVILDEASLEDIKYNFCSVSENYIIGRHSEFSGSPVFPIVRTSIGQTSMQIHIGYTKNSVVELNLSLCTELPIWQYRVHSPQRYIVHLRISIVKALPVFPYMLVKDKNDTKIDFLGRGTKHSKILPTKSP